MTKTFFITGNKRSGTSQLVRLLNLHPRVFISHESDIIWILYRFYNHQPFEAYPEDGPRGMEYTLQKCGHLLDKDKSPAENFFTVQKSLMRQGSPWLVPVEKENLLWVGDKKPFQYSDPELTNFILDFFPETRFIHLIRHPFAVAASAEKFNKTPDGDFWKGITPEEAVKKWAYNEKRVLDLKRSSKTNVLDVRYEDLCRNTEKELSRIFAFLDLRCEHKIFKKARRDTHYSVKNFPEIPFDRETRLVMKEYGYSPGFPKTRFFINAYYKLRKSLN